MSLKPIRLSELDPSETKGAIWVVNTAAQSKYHVQGQLIISVPSLTGGKEEALTVPYSWLPMDAAAHFPRARLLASTEFRKSVNNGLITIISEKDAQRLEETEGAEEERERLNELDEIVRQQASARSISDANVEINGQQQGKGEDEQSVSMFGLDDTPSIAKQLKGKKVVAMDDSGFTNSFIMFANKLKDESDIGALNQIRARAKFTRKEIRYLAQELSNHPKTQKQLQARIAAFE
jgi:hypothetical protein